MTWLKDEPCECVRLQLVELEALADFIRMAAEELPANFNLRRAESKALAILAAARRGSVLVWQPPSA